MLLRFKLHEIRLGRWSHLLLPKLNEEQLEWLASQLTDHGFKVEGRSIIVARKTGLTIHLNSSGHCWSTSDPGDFIVPLIPEVLRFPKQRVPLAELIARYFKVKRFGDQAVARLTTRMESAIEWEALRSNGQCALSPDEKLVASTLIRSVQDGCTLFTDFPVKNGGLRIVGNKQYYESLLGPQDAVATLRDIGHSRPRNSYLPRDNLLRLESFASPTSESLRAISEELGEWCYFTPA